MKFYTADPHFGHGNIIKLSKRPFVDRDDMDTQLINNWNNKVKMSDDVYILGDFCFGVKDFIRYMSQLNGTKHFITGNHDGKAIKQLMNMKHGKDVDKRTLRMCHFHGDIKSVKDGGYDIELCHYPIFEWNRWYRGSIHFHGHCHGNIGTSFRERAYDVGVDCWNYEPVTLEEVLNAKLN